MFRSLEENTGKIHSIKIATQQFSKPETYYSFLSCIKEAMLLNQLDKSCSNLQGLEGYYFRRKKGMLPELEMGNGGNIVVMSNINQYF